MPGIPLDRLYLQEPEWANVFLVIEMFVAGLAAGTYLAYAFMNLGGAREDRRIAHVVGFFPAPLLLLVALLLIFDLGQPLRFWHLILTNPSAIAERGGPFMFNPNSPMTWGSYILGVFAPFTALAFLDGLVGDGVDNLVEALAHNPVILAIGGILGLATGAYPGVMLNVMQQSVWRDNVLLGALYVSMAVLSGLGVAAVVSHWRGASVTAEAVRIALLVTAVVSAVLIALFLASIGVTIVAVAASLTVAPVFWVGVVLIGLAIPILLLLTGTGARERIALAGWLVLLGALAFRYSVLFSAAAALRG